jgi:predicted DNA-binding transcriptional regulator AlpA
MNMIEMENINLIKQIALDIELIKKTLTNATAKRWLNVRELADYLGYSKDRIYKIKEEYFTDGEHFHNKTGKILFDRVAIDSWVVGRTTNDTHKSKRQIVDNILSSVH